MKRLIVHQQTEAFKSGWARGFYGCRIDDGVSCDGPAGVPTNSDRAKWRADLERGFLEGKDRLMGTLPVMPAAESPGDGVIGDVRVTLQVLRQFVGGASIEHIAAGLNVTDTFLEVRLRGAVSAILRLLAERPDIISTPSHASFEAQLLSLAYFFRGGCDRSGKAA